MVDDLASRSAGLIVGELAGVSPGRFSARGGGWLGALDDFRAWLIPQAA